MPIHKDQLLELYKVLDGKNGSQRHACKSHAEANNKVWILDEDAEQTRIYEKYLDMVEVDQEAEETAEYITDKSEKANQVIRKAVNARSRVKSILRWELHSAVCASAAATCSLRCGAGDRTENEKNYLYAALAILRSVAGGDADEDAFEQVFEFRRCRCS